MASQITSLTIVYSPVCSDTDQRKHQSSVSLAFVRGIHRRPVFPRTKRPVTRKMFPFDDVFMQCSLACSWPSQFFAWPNSKNAHRAPSECSASSLANQILQQYGVVCWRSYLTKSWWRHHIETHSAIKLFFCRNPIPWSLEIHSTKSQ